MENDRDTIPEANMIYNENCSKNISKKILKPIRQEKIVKVPVTEYVEKIIEKEEIKYVNKYVDVIKPIITYKTKHIPKPIYLDKIKYETKILEKEKIIHIPKIEYKNRIVEVPVYVHREKIIEKKVPLIIERVIPVLKTTKVEKHEYIDCVNVPEISVMKKEKSAQSHRRYSMSVRDNSVRRESLQIKMGTLSNDKITEDASSDIKTFRLHENEEYCYDSLRVTEMNEYNLKKEGNNSSANSEMESTQEVAREEIEEEAEIKKVDTKYHEYVVEEPRVSLNSVAVHNEMPENEKSENNSMIGDANVFETSSNNNRYSTLGVSIHLPSRDRSYSEFAENRSLQKLEEHMEQTIKNIQINELLENNYNHSSNISDSTRKNAHMFLEPRVNMDYKTVSEQIIREQVVNDPKLYSSFPLNGHYQGSFQSSMRDPNEVETQYVQNMSNNNIPVENYNSIQNVHISINESKQNLRPSFANANGQSMILVRPATIVEQKPKAKTPKTGMCNFLNCCGGK